MLSMCLIPEFMLMIISFYRRFYPKPLWNAGILFYTGDLALVYIAANQLYVWSRDTNSLMSPYQSFEPSLCPFGPVLKPPTLLSIAHCG